MNSPAPVLMDPSTVVQSNAPPITEHSARRYFPGWTMLAVAAMAQYMSAPGQSYSVAAFKEPMRSSLGVSETDYSLAYALATIISGLSLPLVGRLVDRFGARRLLPLIAACLGGACFCMSYVSSLGQLYFGFSFVRTLGQGALTLVAAWLVGEWFERRRGLAMALAGLGGSLSVMTIPLMNRYVIANFGWQAMWIILAVAVWAALVLPAIVFVRNRPEEIGLAPDGDPPRQTSQNISQSALASPDEVSSPWTVGDVLRDRTFWKLLAVPATSGMVGTGLIFHQVSLLSSRGVSPAWALGLISFQAIVATCAALGAGWLTDRYPCRRFLAAAMLLLSCATAIVLAMPTVAFAVIYSFVLGLHGSILRSTGMVVWLTYYGRNHQGAIRGVAMAAMILAAAIGPLPLAFSIDFFGSYNPALWAFVSIPAVSAIVVWTAGPPRQNTAALPCSQAPPGNKVS